MFKRPAYELICQPMKRILSDRNERIIVHSVAPVEQVLLGAGINPLEVIVSCNGNLISEDTIVETGDEIRIIRIAHGG
ncbi:MAG: MoaD/ThiS family protein [Methanoregula sp.]